MKNLRAALFAKQEQHGKSDFWFDFSVTRQVEVYQKQGKL